MHVPLLPRLFGVVTGVLACTAFVPVGDAASLAPDGVDLTFGQGHSVFVSGAALHWNSLCECVDLKEHAFDTRLVAQISYWHAQVHPTANGSLWDAGLTPMLRWLPPCCATAQPFLEAGIGVHLLSHTRINNNRDLGTAFQFGENAGGGIAFGENRRYELGVYVQHESNGSIKEPNNGLTYLGVVLRVALR